MKANDFLSMIADELVVDLKTSVEKALTDKKLTAKEIAMEIGISTTTGIKELYSILGELKVSGKLTFEGKYYYLVN